MMIVRPITAEDHDALWHIALQTGPGFTSLQPDPQALRNKLEWALQSLSAPPEEALYLFVLEDSENGRVVGIGGIESAVGLSAPWYNYKVSTHVHSSRELGVYSRLDTLNLCNDHTGYSELCTLFLEPEYRHSGNGQLLSKSRLLFLAAHRELFSAVIIAEMRGYSDSRGHSPFWEGLGRHFFAMDYDQADRQVSQGKAFIAELMPRHPIYVNLLPEQAQAVIGKTHDNTIAARKILEREGFRYTGYVDIFDAGPLLEAPRNDIRTVRKSRLFRVSIKNQPAADRTPWLLACNRLQDFRCIMGHLSFDGENVCITAQQAQAIQVEPGDQIRVAPLTGSA